MGVRGGRLIAVVTTALVVGAVVPAAAAPARSTGTSDRAPLADIDGNRISDGLDASLRDAAARDRFEVVVTARVAGAASYARGRVGSFRTHRTFRTVSGFHATMTAGQITALSRASGIRRIEENGRVFATNEAANRDFGTEAARASFGVDGSGAGVCVIDTGADRGHEQLNGTKIAGWKDFVNNNAQPYDDHGHGTHVLSIAAGDGTGASNAARLKGVAPGASAYVAKALDANGSGSTANLVGAIDWCTAQPAVDVINMSLGTLGGSDGQDALSQAANNAALTYGVVPVAAAGNAGDDLSTVGSPAAGAHVIAVGAVASYSAPPSAGNHTDGIYKAPFSSAGPTLDGRTKPNVMAPGVRILAAQGGTRNGYVAYDGTSMASPFVAGTIALMKERNPALTPSQIGAILEGTAVDRGKPGIDNDWGAGIIDGTAAVAEAVSGTSYAPHAFPTNENLTGSINNGSTWTHTFTLTSSDLSIPIGGTILLDGELACAWYWGSYCFAWEWSPDLDVALIDPNGTVIYRSECPLQPDCGTYGVGRQETVHAMPTVAGEYRLQVYPFTSGASGTFTVDLSHGPMEGSAPPPNQAPVASDDAYGTNEDTPLSVPAPGVLDNDSDPNGDPLTASMVTDAGNGSVALNADGSFTYTPNAGFSGGDSFTYVANDGTDDSTPATVTITVTAAPPPGSIHIGDLDGASSNGGKNWTATVTVLVETSAHAPVAGAQVSFAWGDGTSGSCTTNGSGTCEVSKQMRKKDGSISFTVTNITGPDPYQQADNHDPDGDSNGTTITVSKP